MSTVYIKSWDELIGASGVQVNSASNILTHRDYNGAYDKAVHGPYGGRRYQANVTADRWVSVSDLWFPCWTYTVLGQAVHEDDFDNDYDAFQAWSNSIDRRKQDIYERVKSSFRKAYPKEYKHEQDENK